MTSFSSLRFLSLCASIAALSLAACDDNDSPATSHPPSAMPAVSESDMRTLLLNKLLPRDPSWAGTYLSSRVAQERFDWARAENFLTQTNDLHPNNPDIHRRLMLLAAGTGNIDKAITYAKMITADTDPSGLTQLVLTLEPLRDRKWITARAQIDGLGTTPLGSYAAPLLRAWIDAAEGKSNFSTLQKDPNYFYHTILLADFLNQIETLPPARFTKFDQLQVNAIALERLGDIFLRHKKYDAAAELYALTATINPRAPQLGDKERAAKSGATDLSHLHLAPPPKDALQGIALVFFDMANTFYNDHGLDSAQLFAHVALSLDPELIDAHLLLANIYARNNRTDMAITAYQDIPETDPRYGAIQQQIAALYEATDQDNDAIATLERLLEKNQTAQEKARILLQIGDKYRENDDCAPALNAYNRAADLLGNKIDAANWELLYARGMTLERLKRWDEAEKDLQAALAYQPDHPYIMNYLGYSWADQGLNLDKAMEMLLRAVKIVPDDGYVTDSVGWAYYRMKKYADAVTYMERAVELLSYDPTVNDHLGDVYQAVGRIREAKFQWQRAFNYSKDDAEKAAIQKKLDAY